MSLWYATGTLRGLATRTTIHQGTFTMPVILSVLNAMVPRSIGLSVSTKADEVPGHQGWRCYSNTQSIDGYIRSGSPINLSVCGEAVIYST